MTVSLCCHGSGLGKQEPLVKPEAHDISRKCIHKRLGQVFAVCNFLFSLAPPLTHMYNNIQECRYGFILPCWKLLRPSGVLYQQQCQLAWQVARHLFVPHVQPEQAHSSKTAYNVSCHQVRLSLLLLQDATAVCLTTNSFTETSIHLIHPPETTVTTSAVASWLWGEHLAVWIQD